jgi:hypothetical protein
VLLLATAAFAQDQRPLPRGAPDAVVGPPPKVHVRVHEDLDPDRLRDLARPGVTLWLSTSSNTLRASTLENLGRFDVAWVELRPPLRPHDALSFRRLPSVGAWLTPQTLEVAGRLPGARRLAVRLEGALDEARLASLQRARPSEVRWTPAGPVDLLQWSLFRQLPGHQVVAAPASSLLAVKCPERAAGEPALEVHVATLLALSSDVFPCGPGMRVVVQPTIDPWLLQSLRVRDPSVELVIDVGADPRLALGARALLDQLGLGPSR